MAASSWVVYSNFLLAASNTKNINLGTDTFVMVLANTNYVPTVQTDATYTTIKPDEVPTGSGYTQGGVALSTVLNTLSGNTVTFTAANTVWTGFSATFRYGVIIHSANSNGVLGTSDTLVCFSDLGGGSSVTGGGGTLTIQENASGIFSITASPTQD